MKLMSIFSGSPAEQKTELYITLFLAFPAMTCLCGVVGYLYCGAPLIRRGRELYSRCFGDGDVEQNEGAEDTTYGTF